MKNLKKCRFALPSLPPWWATRRRPNCCRSVSESLFMWISDLNCLRNNPPCLTFGRLGILTSNDTTLYLLPMTKGLSMLIIADAKAILILEMIWMNTMAQIVMPLVMTNEKEGLESWNRLRKEMRTILHPKLKVLMQKKKIEVEFMRQLLDCTRLSSKYQAPSTSLKTFKFKKLALTR